MERLVFTGRSSPRLDNAGVTAVAPAPLAAAVHRGEVERDVAAFNALLAFMVVLFFRPQDSLPILEPLHLADLTAGFAVIALVMGRLSRGAALSRFNNELNSVLALAALMLVTAPFSIWPGGSIAVLSDLYGKVIIIFVLMLNTVTTRERFARLVTIVVVGTSYIAIRAVTDYARGVNLHEDGRVGGAVGGLFGNPNDMALNLVTFLPLAVALALVRRRPMLRALALVAVPAMAAAIVFSKSRGGALGLIAMLLVLMYQMCRIRPAVAALVVVLCFAALPMLPASFTDRMASIWDAEQDTTGSREARRRLLREGYEAFLANPIVGLGAGQFSNYQPEDRDEPWRETHNSVLQVASELGIFGLVVFIILVVSGFGCVLRATGALRRTRHPPPNGVWARRELELFGAALVASLTGWFAAAMFASVAYYWTFYLILGLATTFSDITVRDAEGVMDARHEFPRAEAA
jgi:O-antigen ligase